MSKDLNLCQFIGRLGNDPDARMTAQGTATSSFNLACGDDYKDKNSGQKVEQTNWIRCVAFGRLAEIMNEYLKKGSKVYVSGKQVTRKWQDKKGVDQFTTEVNVSDMQMLDGKPEGQNQQTQQSYHQPNQAYGQVQPKQMAPQYATQPSPHSQNPQNYAQNQHANYQQNNMPQDDFDSTDIPF